MATKNAGDHPGVALLDVNALVALVWPHHQAHRAVTAWFKKHSKAGWATTPFTEAGLVRLSTNRSVIANAATPTVALAMLHQLTALPGHHFWPDTVRGVCSPTHAEQLVGHKQITDAHLLALCLAHQGHLVTLDAKILTYNLVEPNLIQVLTSKS